MVKTGVGSSASEELNGRAGSKSFGPIAPSWAHA